jgi:hypothetical protein
MCLMCGVCRRIVDQLSVGFDGSQWGANGPELLTQAGHAQNAAMYKIYISINQFLNAFPNPQRKVKVQYHRGAKIEM